MSNPNPPPNLTENLQRLSNLSHTAAFNLTQRSYNLSTLKRNADEDIALTIAIKHLQQQLIDQELVLSALQSSNPTLMLATPTSETTKEKKNPRKIRAEILANNRTAVEDLILPPTSLPRREGHVDENKEVNSPLPEILALRAVSQSIAATSASLPRVTERLETAQHRLAEMRGWIAEQMELKAALEKKLPEMKQVDGGVVDGVEALAEKKKELHKRSTNVLKALVAFLGKVLGEMLDEEEAGGVVAGMAAGGKGKGREKGQLTIEDSFTQRRKEVKALLVDLMNRCVNGGDAYIVMERETAAVRFLVRAGVAVLHPRDRKSVV